MDMTRNWNKLPKTDPTPNFDNLLAVLRHEKPDRPTLFEFFMNGPLNRRLAGVTENDALDNVELTIKAFCNAGYDYATVHAHDFSFPTGERDRKDTISLNDGAVLTSREDFESYPWPEADKCDYSVLDRATATLPEGMKILSQAPGGLLENTIKLMGYENLCFTIADDTELVKDITNAIGSRLVRHYEILAAHDAVGGIIGNDDWGFKTQPMLSPDDMRRYIVPWHKRIVAAAHAEGKPAIMHSCGCLTSLMDDIIDDIGYDGKHSYEDTIQPVESAYEQYHERIAIMGGMDLDFVCRSTPEEVYKRSRNMLELSADSGSYALGTGNSVPEYVPDENYFAMISAVLDARQE